MVVKMEVKPDKIGKRTSPNDKKNVPDLILVHAHRVPGTIYDTEHAGATLWTTGVPCPGLLLHGRAGPRSTPLVLFWASLGPFRNVPNRQGRLNTLNIVLFLNQFHVPNWQAISTKQLGANPPKPGRSSTWWGRVG